MITVKASDSSVTYRNPRDSGQPPLKDENKKKIEQVSKQEQGGHVPGLKVPTTSNNGAAVKPFCKAVFARNLFRITQGPLTIQTRVNILNSQLIASIPGGDTALMSRIIAEGANPNATCRLDHVSACHIAAMHDNDALNLLLSLKAVSSRRDKHGRTPLHLASWAGNAKQIALLLNIPEALMNTVSSHAVLLPKTVQEVTKHTVPVNMLTNVPCRRNDGSTLPEEWSNLMDPNCRNMIETDGQRYTQPVPTHNIIAFSYCSPPAPTNFMKTVDLLLKAGGKFLKDVDQRNPVDTPLHTAVELGSKAAVELMMQGGASAAVWNSRGLTAMHVCVEKRNQDLLQFLAKHNSSNEDTVLVPVDVTDRTGSNVLCAVVKANWIQGVCIALDAGASITMKANGELPIHIAAQLGNIDIVQHILNVAQPSNINNYSNEEKATALFNAIINNHQDVLELLLKNDFSIEAVNADKTNVFHIATKYGRKEILKYLLGYDNDVTKKLINLPDCVARSPLYYAVENNYLDCAELLLSKGAQTLNSNQHYEKATLLHIAARKNHCEIADMIIKHDSSTVHVTAYKLKWTPLHEACFYGNREMIVLLLKNGADLSENSNIAVQCPIMLLMKYVSNPTDFLREIFDSYISQDASDQNCSITDRTINVDYTVLDPPPPLCTKKVGTTQMRTLPCTTGQDTSDQRCSITDRTINVDHTVSVTPCPSLCTENIVMTEMRTRPRSTSQDASDQSFLITDRTIDVENTVSDTPCPPLSTENAGRTQMRKRPRTRVIQALLDTGNIYDQQRLLLHPLVESFLYLQWRSLLSFFYILWILHGCFLLSLNMFAMSLFGYQDSKNEPLPYKSPSSVWIYIIYFTALLIIMQDIFIIKKNGIRNLKYLETWIRLVSTSLAMVLPVIVLCYSKPHAEWVRLFTSVTLLFSWVKVMYLFSRLPELGYYVLMYEKVAKRVMKVLVSLGFLIVGFATTFMIQFHAQRPFEGFWSSLLMTMVMMSSEPGYKDNFDKDHKLASLTMLRIIFAAFLFLLLIVLMNMLVGVAVNDVNDLEALGNMKRLEKQLEFITAFEGNTCRNFVKKILPSSLYRRWFKEITWETVIKMRSGSFDKSICSNWYHLPAPLRETIFEKAQLQKKQSDEKKDTKLYNMKLDEMHKVIVKNDNGEPTTTLRLASLEKAINKIFEEMYKLRTENAETCCTDPKSNETNVGK